MSGERINKSLKTFYLKNENIDKVEDIARNSKKKQSNVVDEMIEEYNNGAE